jgi:hypothetical protein
MTVNVAQNSSELWTMVAERAGQVYARSDPDAL